MGASNPTEEVDDEQEDAGDLFILGASIFNNANNTHLFCPKRTKKWKILNGCVFWDEKLDQKEKQGFWMCSHFPSFSLFYDSIFVYEAIVVVIWLPKVVCQNIEKGRMKKEKDFGGYYRRRGK